MQQASLSLHAAQKESMSNVLLVTSSPRGDLSHSTRVATDLAHRLGGALTVRELWRDPPPFLDPETVHAVYTPETGRSPEQKAALGLSDAAIAELMAADTVIVAAGMINFGMPTPLKAWIDLVVRAGVTFRYGEAGLVGLITDKRLILVLAAGGVYSTGPMQTFDHLDSALRATLGTLGLTDVETIWIEGTAFGEEATERALEGASARVAALAGAASAA